MVPDQHSKGTLGAFLGVYTPAILTILGVIMYLRFGWVIGHLGSSRSNWSQPSPSRT